MTKIPRKTFLILLPAIIWGLVSCFFYVSASFGSGLGGCNVHQITWIVNCNEPLETLQLITLGLPALIVGTFFEMIYVIVGDIFYSLLGSTGIYLVLFLVLTMLLSYFIILFLIRLITFFKSLDKYNSQ